MRVEQLNHVQIAMPRGQENTARQFYTELLEIPEVPKPARGGCWFERGDLKIHLGVDEDFRPARKAHLASVVTGLDVLIARLTAAGFEVVEDEPLAGYNRRYVADPFGNRLELMEPSGPRPTR